MQPRPIRLLLALCLACLTVATAASARPPAGDWELVWEDSFEAPELDVGHWSTCYWWAVESEAPGCTIATNDELEWYVPEQVRVAGGTLRLLAERREANGHPFVSGMVSSYGRFSYRYGYLEARVRAARGAGLWSALWLLPSDGEWPPEVDILEVRGDWPRRVLHNLHYATVDDRDQIQSWQKRRDLTRGWHVFGLLWTPTELVWTIDGRRTHRVTRHVPAELMHVIANLAVGGHFPGPPDGATRFPAKFELDYLRVWQDRGVAKRLAAFGDDPAGLVQD